MGRPRKAGARHLPPNLYNKDGRYVWRHPGTGKTHPLGRDMATAIIEATEANVAISTLAGRRRLVDRINDMEDRSVSLWVERYISEILSKREIAKTTLQDNTRKLRAFAEEHGDLQIDAVTTANIADYLREYTLDGKYRMAQATRSVLRDLFLEAGAAGWVDRNVVELTRPISVTVCRARIDLPDVLEILRIAERDYHPWAANAILLALVTGQRRSDVLAIGPENVRDGRLWVKQQKSGVNVTMPLTLRLDAIGLTVGDVIERCSDSRTLRDHYVHHVAHKGATVPGDPLRARTVSSMFSACLELACPGRTWVVEGVSQEDVEPPSLHELRSLAGRLYKSQGANSQHILGHRHAATTALYLGTRQEEWVVVDG